MPLDPPERFSLAFIGGTGPEGRGLATRFAALGHSVIIGSRSQDRAAEAAKEVEAAIDGAHLTGARNDAAAASGEIIVLTIPFGGVDETLPPLAEPARGKIVVSAIAPIEFVDGRPVARRPEAGSAGQHVGALLPESRVVSAFQTLDARRVQDIEQSLDTDVIVCSDDVEARRLIVRLANQLSGVRALSGGRLAASRYVEECTALLVTLNRIYKAHSGVRFTGIDR